MGYFRRKAFKKLREQVTEFDYYEINKTSRIFGWTFGRKYYQFRNIEAENIIHALNKFFKIYRNKYKENYERYIKRWANLKETEHFQIINKRTSFDYYF